MKLLFIFLTIFPLFTYAQETLKYSDAIEVLSVDSDELFIRGREWFNDYFKSSKDVLQISDKETGELSGKGIMKVDYTFKYMGEIKFTTNVSFQINIWVKKGKYKYEITNFNILGDNGNIDFGLLTTANETTKTFPGYSSKKMNEIYLSIKQGVETKAKLLIVDIKSKMLQKSKSTDW